jgi:ACS family glucarate transporter-like MFS transporter
VRHRILALTTSMAVLLYLDRVCLSLIAPALGADLCFNESQVALILSLFFLGYALAQVPAGWLGDRLGARAMLTACVLAWSLCTALTGVVAGLALLVSARLLCGIAQAGAYPIAARVNSLWTPFPRRAMASSIIALGGRAGGALAPVATAYLIGLFGGWRPVLWYYGLLGAAWALFFWRAFRQTPAEHPSCNPAEVELIESSRPVETASPHGTARGLPWAAAGRSLSLWLQCITQFTTTIGWTFLITWLPTYLIDVYGVDIQEAGVLASFPLLAGMAGCVLGGVLTDSLTRRLGIKWGRNLLGMLSKFLAAAALLAAILAQDALLATLALAGMSFAIDMGQGATWAYFQDAGGPYVGTLLGWANMFGNLGSFVSPLLLNGLKDEYGWPHALAISAAALVVSGLCWTGMDARKPIVPSAKPSG